MGYVNDVTSYMNQVAARALPDPPPIDELPAEVFTPRHARVFIDAAAPHTTMGSDLEGHTRFRFPKRAIYRVSRLFIHRQVMFNEATLGALRSLDFSVMKIEQKANRAATAMAAVEIALQDTVNDLETRIERLEETNAEAASELTDVKERLSELTRQVESR
ncbi:MAG: hypothetical protein KDB86_05575 [Actinobacteria bacterium]|nr:hypothetical protein [Actinomycetota bacterium]MCB9390625.1 hypothetical protein [Acidimicrobiia bacterium]